MLEQNLTISSRPTSLLILGITLLLFGIFAFLGSILLWGKGSIFNPPSEVDLSFPITDIVVNAPASIITGIGLIKMRNWSKFLAWFVAGFYIYASVEIFIDVIQEGILLPEIVIPQIFAIIVAIFLMIETHRYEETFT